MAEATGLERNVSFGKSEELNAGSTTELAFHLNTRKKKQPSPRQSRAPSANDYKMTTIRSLQHLTGSALLYPRHMLTHAQTGAQTIKKLK